MVELVGDAPPAAGLGPVTPLTARRFWAHHLYYATASRWRGRRAEELRASVVVSGSPRSGTTWLGNIVAELTGWPWMEETTGSTRNPGLRVGHGWGGRPFRDPDEADDRLARDLEQVLTGRYLGPGLIFANRQNTAGLWLRRPMICKLIDVNFMLPWMAGHLPWLRVVQIVRHPFAVVASRRELENTVWARDTSLSEPYLQFMAARPAYAGPTDFDTPEETQVASWALEHAWLRDNLDRLGAVHWIRYEDLKQAPDAEVARLCAYLDVPARPAGALTTLARPSRTTNREVSTLPAGSDPWERRFDHGLVERMTAILEHYGFPFYGLPELSGGAPEHS